MVRKKKFHKELRKIKLEIPKKKSEEKKEIKPEEKKVEQKEQEKIEEKKEPRNEEQKTSEFSERILDENIGFTAPVISSEFENSGERFTDSLEDVAGSVPLPASLPPSTTGNLYEIRSNYGNSTSGTYDNGSSYDMNKNNLSLSESERGFDPFGINNGPGFSRLVTSNESDGMGNNRRGNSERENYSTTQNLEKITPSGRKNKRESF